MRRLFWREHISQLRSQGRIAKTVAAVVGAAVVFCLGGSICSAQSGQARLPGETFRDCPECVELVVVPAGEYQMGSNAKAAEAPVHKVTIKKDLAIGRREVTFAEWDRCVTAGACKYSPPDPAWGRGDEPVTNVSWDDAKDFVAWLAKKTGKPYRLPSEAEWEYAARGGSALPFWWGKAVGTGRAQCADCGVGETGRPVVVGSFRPNAFGLYDTAGNAAEWVEDCWTPSYRGAPNDGSAWMSGDCSLHVLRGGSFNDKAEKVGSASRFRYDEDVRYYANGFRVARDLN